MKKIVNILSDIIMVAILSLAAISATVMSASSQAEITQNIELISEIEIELAEGDLELDGNRLLLASND